MPRARGGIARHGDAGPLAEPIALESPFERTAGNELERRIEAALASLSVDAREVLLLVGVEGMTPSEAAAVCGVPPRRCGSASNARAALLAARLAESDPRPVDASS